MQTITAMRAPRPLDDAERAELDAILASLPGRLADACAGVDAAALAAYNAADTNSPDFSIERMQTAYTEYARSMAEAERIAGLMS